MEKKEKLDTNYEPTEIKNIKELVRDGIKNFMKKYMLLFVAAIFLIVIVTINVGWAIFTPASNLGELTAVNWIAVILSLVSAVFGILNITTYSLYNPHSKHRNKFKIFIVFNFLAVFALAVVNITSDLWFLVFENIVFAGSGMYQYYAWFIKTDKEETKPEDEVSFHYAKWDSKGAKIMYGVLPLIALAAVGASLALSVLVFHGGDWSTINTRDIIGAVVDGVAFTISATAAFLVAKKLTNSQWLYIASDIILIAWWGYLFIASLSGHGLTNNQTLDTLTAVNLVALFSFYMSSNIINIKLWGKVQNYEK